MKVKVNTAEIKKQAAELRKKFAQYSDGVRDQVGKAVLKSCIKVKTDGKALTPVATGLLRASMSEKIVTRPTGTDGYVGSNVDYALPVETGSKKRGTKGRFMLTRALRQNLTRIREWIKAGIKAAAKGIK
jgi:hypothetical protein